MESIINGINDTNDKSNKSNKNNTNGKSDKFTRGMINMINNNWALTRPGARSAPRARCKSVSNPL